MAINKSDFIIGICDKYDEKLLHKRREIEGNVIGCLASDILLIDDSMLKPTDFITKDGRFLFSVLKSMRDRGCTVADEVTTLTNITDSMKEKLEEIGGWRQVQNIVDSCNTKNFDVFLDDLNKANICLRLNDKGFNLLEPVVLDNGKEVVPYKMFEKFNSQEVLDFYESQLSTLGTVSSNKIIDEGYIDFDEEFIEGLEIGTEVGVSFADAGLDVNGNKISTFPFLSNNILGLKSGTLSAFGAHSGVGKTTFMIGILMSLIEKGEKVLIVSNEMGLSDFKQGFLVWILSRYFNYRKLPKKKLASGNIDDEDRAMIKMAREYWRKNYAKQIKMVALSDADAKLTCRIIKKHIQRDGITTFLVDTFKITTSNGSNDNFWLQLVMDSKDLDAIAKRYDVIGLMTIQLAINSLGRLWMDASCLSNSRAVKEVLSNLILFRKIYPDELVSSSPIYLKPFRSKKREDGKWYEEPYLPDPTNVYRCLFVEKSRRGIDSGDSGVAYLVRYDGDYCSFYETAKARPSHKTVNNG